MLAGYHSTQDYAYLQSLERNITVRSLILQPSGGNVGIGTTTPGDKLTVAGVIASTTGGFRFPDGTVQTTATLRGPQGNAGPPGPPGPAVTTSAVCVDGLPQSLGGQTCGCPGGRLISIVPSPCRATADTGTCNGSSAIWQGIVQQGACCVCSP